MKYVILFFMALGLSASDTKHLEMDYGDILSMSVDSQWPEKEHMTHKAIVQRLDTLALPAKGTPIGKGRYIKVRRDPIAKTENDIVYQNQRERSTGYLIALPEGEYKITLQFAEIKRKSAGERVFDILVQGKKIKENFDPFKVTGGQFIAVDVTVDKVKVEKFFRLEFIQKSARSTPAIAGIVIEGKDLTKKINCGGEKEGGYEADWDKNTYMDDPFSTGVIFDAELLRYSAAWINGFVRLKGTAYDATHGTHPEIQGNQIWGSGLVPGWHFGKFSAEDPRKDHLGHLPKDWAHYKGLFRHQDGNVITYTVGNSLLYDNMSLLKVPGEDVTQAYVRTVQGNLQHSAWQLIAEFPKGEKPPAVKGNIIDLQNGCIIGAVGLKSTKFKILTRKAGDEDIISVYVQADSGNVHYATAIYKLTEDDKTAAERFAKAFSTFKPTDLKARIKGGETRWPGTVTTKGTSGENSSQLTVDEITMPENNPWRSWMRPGAFDFFADGKSMAISTWSGDVWIVKNLDDINNLKWKRYAAGLFHPLGLKIVEGKIYVQCRDQISILHDLNNDGEADWYQNFNNDVVITANFHEFSFELQRDKKGNFYFIKGAPVIAGGEGFGEIKEHHGCLFKVSPDGSKLEVIATGFRAPNGMGLNEATGQLTTSDNEGNWVAATPLNWVEEGGFYGVIPTSHKEKIPAKRSSIICWIPHEVDNSAGGQVWIPEGEWGSLGGEMLHMSYGQASLFQVLRETVDGQIQGGVINLNPAGGFDAGIMRGRFNNIDKGVYVAGLKGWQTKGVKDGGIYRVRYNNIKKCRPSGLSAGQNGLKITFTEPVDELSALDAGNYEISQWVYEISDKYGSKHFKVPEGSIWGLKPKFSPVPAKDLAEFDKKEFKDEAAKEAALKQLYGKYIGEDQVEIKSISLSEDKKTVFLEIPGIRTVMQMHISFEIESAAKKAVKADIYNTIHKLGKWQGKPGKAVTTADLTAPKPGLVVQYTHRGQKKEDIRVQRMAAFYVGEKTAVTQFLDHGPFDAQLDGFIKVERNIKADLLIAGSGTATVSLNGSVIGRDLKEGGLIKQAAFKKGFNKIHIDYRGPAKGDSSFRLYWESLAFFPKEPVPATVLYHEGGQAKVTASQMKRHGLDITLKNNCFACHTDTDKSRIPEMQNFKMSMDSATRLNPQWISQWLKSPKDQRPSARMPQMLKSLPESQWESAAADLAAFLVPEVKASNPVGDAAAGKVIYGNLGCASCHAFKEESLEKGMVLLKNAGFKFQHGAMAEFISAPQKYNPQSRMPDFGLSSGEAQNLEAYIRSQVIKRVPAKVTGDADKGKSLYQKLNCAACHTHKNVTSEPKILNFAGKSGGCLTGGGDGKPVYKLKGKDKAAVEAYLKSVSDSLLHFQPAEYAERQIQTLNCLNCHTRDGMASNWKSPNVQPLDALPSLTHVGEKLVGPYLKNVLSGETGKMRQWQKSRMPAFKSQAAKLALGLNQMHGFSDKDGNTQGNEADGGKPLIGQTAFACILCHNAGETKALAPFGAPGLDLEVAGERLRHEYYLRWMLNPKRVEPSTHMTKFTLEGHRETAIKAYNNDAEKQFNAIWDYIRELSK